MKGNKINKSIFPLLWILLEWNFLFNVLSNTTWWYSNPIVTILKHCKCHFNIWNNLLASWKRDKIVLFSNKQHFLPKSNASEDVNELQKCHTGGIMQEGVLSLGRGARWELPWMVNHYPQDGHPPYHGWSLIIKNLPEGIVLQTWNLASRLNSQNQDQVTTVRDGQSPSPGWSPTIHRMVTNHPKSTDLDFGTKT